LRALQLPVRNRYINGSPTIIPISLYFIVGLFYHTAQRSPVKPRAQISPIIPKTKRVTPKATKSSPDMFPSLIRGAKIWRDLLCDLTDNRRNPALALKLKLIIPAILIYHIISIYIATMTISPRCEIASLRLDKTAI